MAVTVNLFVWNGSSTNSITISLDTVKIRGHVNLLSLLGLSYFEVISLFVLLFLPEVKCIVGFLAVPSQVTADAYLIKLAEQQHFGEMENLAACELKIGTAL